MSEAATIAKTLLGAISARLVDVKTVQLSSGTYDQYHGCVLFYWRRQERSYRSSEKGGATVRTPHEHVLDVDRAITTLILDRDSSPPSEWESYISQQVPPLAHVASQNSARVIGSSRI